MKQKKISDSTWEITVGSYFEEGKISGGFSPMYSAQAVAKAMDEPLLGMLNVNFRTTDGYWDSRIYEEIDENSGFGFFIAVLPHMVIAFVDRGCRIETLAACYDDGEVDLSRDTYTRWHSKLSPERMTQMMREANTIAQSYKADLRDKMTAYKALNPTQA